MNRLRKFAVSIVVTFVAFAPLLIASPSAAETTAGLTQDVYTYDSSSTPDRLDTYKLCSTSTVDTMNFDVGTGTVANCQEDFVLIHWTGYITMPFSGETTFYSMADDGFYLNIGESNVIDDWRLKGCGGSSGTHAFEAGVSQKIDAWWYEYGGGACNYLYYQDPKTGFTLIPNSVFTTSEVSQPVEPSPEPTVEPSPLPSPTPEPTPTVTPEPTPTPQPTPEPTIEPTPTPLPTPEPTQTPVEKGPEPKSTPAPDTVAQPAAVDQTPAQSNEPVSKPETENTSQQILTADPATIDPQSLTPQDVVALQAVANETLATAPEDSPEYQNALDQLYVAAQADDIEVDPELAATPVIGAVAVGITNAINAIGNVGADMSPAHRAVAKKEVVVAVVAVGAAVSAATGAATSAAAAASSSSSIRRKS